MNFICANQRRDIEEMVLWRDLRMIQTGPHTRKKEEEREEEREEQQGEDSNNSIKRFAQK